MLNQPVTRGRAATDRAADEHSYRSANEAANQHAPSRAGTLLDGVPTIMTGTFELTFVVDVRAFDIRIGQCGVEIVALTGGENHSFRKDADRGLAGDAAGCAHLRDPPLDGRA